MEKLHCINKLDAETKTQEYKNTTIGNAKPNNTIAMRINRQNDDFYL